LPELIETLTPVITTLLDMKFAFFGHSMGAIIAFELARELRRRNGPQPEQIFVSGRRAPQISDDDPITYDLPEDEFRAELLRLKGTPVEVLEHAELMSFMLPLLRADFELIQTYQYSDDLPLHCPISVYGGLQDEDVPRELLLLWKRQTDAQFSLHMLPGDHFFLRSASRILLDLLRQELFRITATP
jgi:surfactin synthase thioesterase subunit